MQDKVIASAAEAVADIRSGASIFVGGFGGSGIPTQLLAALLARTSVTDLTLVNNNAGAGDASFVALVRAGRVRRIVCSYPRMPGSEVLRELVLAGKLEVDVMPQGTLVERIRGAGAGLGPFFTPTGYGTPFASGKESRVIDGRGYILEQPLHADYAFINAWRADRLGNLEYRYAQRNFGPVMCTAAKTTIVEADAIVATGALDPCHIVTPSVFVSRVVRRESCAT
ncbi:3-oxoacid CoA-transferase subunit A [Cupriavidus taiwanensis]|uniref:Acetyl-CoA:acetoacetyl-CoA transferase, alpha subunit n=1 Tax=Cupriavidus taiwanensis TaxID=164546 RepID=A0A7Z7NPU8_9BURK|nr:3-oxoacid CoA-transferase subunit A [Cupriavidus taiwanensis]SOZ10143.1 acetyl-CoA:acetoacetyl-CoA transferase, alpha subunit [Cupriavidus taiwanensis]SOZ12312.1 acetyl-CoA:acetoacetyl-CoA transferase, alpha subunit [Cupriavidus taiwanensis]SOZ43617.1 acetyl-CoA:acetoacetyl-CoA transferase, alpha subunit [Cupriavidus taiwanensis]SPC22860.1 acetyl-CoA:acetoacetyl-CoA transferase, alpha subunit [Cupriavidus taiwanensis]SPD54368.1 acetyl-CoA:acetoacetyl-CoA transferase, alpha subunit [Cupriavi